jgi:hypothetical protein
MRQTERQTKTIIKNTHAIEFQAGKIRRTTQRQKMAREYIE